MFMKHYALTFFPYNESLGNFTCSSFYSDNLSPPHLNSIDISIFNPLKVGNSHDLFIAALATPTGV